jgi:predicted ATPase
VAAGLTQGALAERAGLSAYGIHKLERGATHPYRDTAERLVSALQLDPDQAQLLRARVEPVRRRGSAPHPTAIRAADQDLPIALTSFIGRERELVDLSEQLETARLVTLTGAGGSGKTRLALEVARRVADHYADGVRLVELAQVTDHAHVAQRLGAVLGIRETTDRLMLQVLADALRDAQVLLVVDNCEHVLDASASLVDLLLRECHALQVLATSREPIGIPGEVSWMVPPLTLPHTAATSSFSEISRSPAVRLFVDRASTAQPRFALTEKTALPIVQVCRQLDGIPLALELAAACLDALSVQELATRLDRRFLLLTNGNRAALPRQQTLAAAVDWSYQLLTDAQRRAFERLSVFASGWTLEAAEAVCAGGELASEDVVHVVVQLVRKSLVVRIGDGRYGLLETLREYALEKLRSRGGELEDTRERHASHYSALVEQLGPVAATRLLPFNSGTPARSVIETLEDAQDNVRVALRWWLDAQSVIEGLRLICALGPLWIADGVPSDGRRWVEAMLDLAEQHSETVPTALRAHALLYGGVSARIQGDFVTARTFYERCVAMYRTLEDDLGLAYGLAHLGSARTYLREFGRAAEALGEAIFLARGAGDSPAISTVLSHLGMLAYFQGEPDRATEILRECLTTARTEQPTDHRRFSVGRALTYLGRALSEQGKFGEAMEVFEQGVTGPEARVAGVIRSMLLDWTAAAFSATGQPLRAARLMGAGEAQWLASGAKRFDPRYERDLHAIKAQLHDEEFAEAFAQGRAMTSDEATAHMLRET